MRYPEVTLGALSASELTVWGDSGSLVLWAVPEDTSYHLPVNGRVRLEIVTTGGDAEYAYLAPLICPKMQYCHTVNVWMKAGGNAREVTPLVWGVPARFTVIVSAGRLGELFVFHPERVDRLIADLRSHSGVEAADRGAVITTGDPPQFWRMYGGLPLSQGPVTPMDGFLQGTVGDTATVRYQQPNGDIAQIVVPLR